MLVSITRSSHVSIYHRTKPC